jgi:hypothetical protein
MACPTNRCALRRFDGHGTNSYRPTNPEVQRQFDSSLQNLIAQRERQDKGIFGSQPSQTQAQSEPVSQVITSQPVQPHAQNYLDFAPLSDSKIK